MWYEWMKIIKLLNKINRKVNKYLKEQNRNRYQRSCIK